MKALRGMVFKKVQNLLDVKRIEDPENCGYDVSLLSVAAWQLHELRLHGNSNRHLQLNRKLDGRPFFGGNCSLKMHFLLHFDLYHVINNYSRGFTLTVQEICDSNFLAVLISSFFLVNLFVCY